MPYEVTAPLSAASVVLYWFGARGRDVAARGLLDLTTVALVLGFLTSRTSKTIHLGFEPMLTQARAIARQGWLVTSESVFPFYSVP